MKYDTEFRKSYLGGHIRYHLDEADIKFWADVCKHCGKDPDDGPDGVAEWAEYRGIEE